MCLQTLETSIQCLQRIDLAWSLRNSSPGSRNAPFATALNWGLLLDNLKWLPCSPSLPAHLQLEFSGNMRTLLNTHAVQTWSLAKKKSVTTKQLSDRWKGSAGSLESGLHSALPGHPGISLPEAVSFPAWSGGETHPSSLFSPEYRFRAQPHHKAITTEGGNSLLGTLS